MINTAVAVCKTIENCGLSPVIKWPNDVLINGRKVSGTLIENTFSGNRVARSIVGVGLNVNNTLSPELEQIATSLSQEKGKKLDLEKITDFFISALNDEYTVADYKKYINWFGLPITLVKGDEKLVAVAKDVALDGRLICQIDGKEVQVSSGEVTLRF
jgi:BirA family biotin operon repressor/biotin-[acetyl-CoA-carboxylase] ligase